MMSLKRVCGKILCAGILMAAVTAALADGPATRPSAEAGGHSGTTVVLPVAPKVVATAHPMIDTPASVADLKKMQAEVEGVVKRCLPATVGISTNDGQGSGIIISKDGLVLTAAHVIEKPNIKVRIVFPDGHWVPAITLGMDHTTDTGMLKITKPGDYPFVEVGQSTPLKRGEWVVALGHPGGIQAGRPPVARLGRVLTAVNVNKTNQLDTDCTLIMGDSGGPLFDLEGHLVGIHSRISRGADNNMHVPIDAFITSWQRLARGDEWGSQMALMGLPDPTLTGASMGFTGEDDTKGCKVALIMPNSPAEKGGMKVGDVVTALDGNAVATVQGIHDELDNRKPGQKMNVDVLRDGKKLTLSLTLGARGG